MKRTSWQIKANKEFKLAKKCFKQSFTYLTKQTMKTLINTIIGLAILGVLTGVGVIAYANQTPDFNKEISNLLQSAAKNSKLSEENTQKALDLSCDRIGDLYNDCFDKVVGACKQLHDVASVHRTLFGDDAYWQCDSTNYEDAPESDIAPMANDDPEYGHDDPNCAEGEIDCY